MLEEISSRDLNDRVAAALPLRYLSIRDTECIGFYLAHSLMSDADERHQT